MGHDLARLVAFEKWRSDRPEGDFLGHYRVDDKEELQRLGEAERAVKAKLLAKVEDSAEYFDQCLGKMDGTLFNRRVADLKEAVEADRGDRDVEIMVRRIMGDFI